MPERYFNSSKVLPIFLSVAIVCRSAIWLLVCTMQDWKSISKDNPALAMHIWECDSSASNIVKIPFAIFFTKRTNTHQMYSEREKNIFENVKNLRRVVHMQSYSFEVVSILKWVFKQHRQMIGKSNQMEYSSNEEATCDPGGKILKTKMHSIKKNHIIEPRWNDIHYMN